MKPTYPALAQVKNLRPMFLWVSAVRLSAETPQWRRKSVSTTWISQQGVTQTDITGKDEEEPPVRWLRRGSDWPVTELRSHDRSRQGIHGGRRKAGCSHFGSDLRLGMVLTNGPSCGGFCASDARQKMEHEAQRLAWAHISKKSSDGCKVDFADWYRRKTFTPKQWAVKFQII